MNAWKHWSPVEQATLLLRVGLAFVFIYAATNSLLYPNDWLGYLPSFLLHLSFASTLLMLLAVGQLFLALWLLTNYYVRYAAVLCAAMFLGILLAQPSVFSVTFRDVGLLFMSLALVALGDSKQPSL